MSDCTAIHERFFAETGLDLEHPELAAHLAACATCTEIAAALPLLDRELAAIAQAPVAIPSFDRIAPAAARAASSRRAATRIRRHLPAAITGLAAAAAALVIATFVGTGLGGGTPPTLEVGAQLDGHAAIREAVLESGARVRLDAGAIRLAAPTPSEERLVLATGSATFEVPKLPAGRTLAVETPDAEVRVHGTRFQVVRDARGTSVSVTEGLVEVRPEGQGRPPRFLRPGESTVVEPLDRYRDSTRAAALAALERGQFDQAEERIGSLLATEPAPALRAEALALSAWATAARGDGHAAIARYREALSILPHDERPLWSDNAAAELALLLEREEPAAAAQAWAEYLRRFPAGAHAALARSHAQREEAPE